jgi:lactate permease
MKWTQVVDPLHSMPASVALALLPMLFVFWALAFRRWKVYAAVGCALLIAVVIAGMVYRMPVSLLGLSLLNGALYGLFPICWIVVAAVFLFNLTVVSGQFDIIKSFMASVTDDRRMQALLIAFSFGAFLEGTAGFGAPVAITAAMLTGLGFEPLYAAGICLIANTAPVAFGSIGIPITVAAQVTGLPETAISQMVGRTLPFLSALLPFYLVTLMAGFRKAKEVMPAIFVSGGSFALIQWGTSNFMGPWLPDILAGVGSIVCLLVYLRFQKPVKAWRFPSEVVAEQTEKKILPKNQIVFAMSPFILLTVMVIGWGLPSVKEWLNNAGQWNFAFPGLHESIISPTGQPIAHIFKFNYLSAAGTAIFITALLTAWMGRLTIRQSIKVARETLVQLRLPVITIATVLAFAYVVNDSGITATIAKVLAGTGILFPLFAPVLGWLGVFVTGSDTSANALFGKLQAGTATSLGIDPVITVSANVSGGVVGKMISPQSIAVAAAAGKLPEGEGRLFRFTLKHSLLMLAVICLLVVLQASLLRSWVPVYQAETPAHAIAATTTSSNGAVYLLLLTVLVIMFITSVRRFCASPKKRI